MMMDIYRLAERVRKDIEIPRAGEGSRAPDFAKVERAPAPTGYLNGCRQLAKIM